jgi:hypothetical protein
MLAANNSANPAAIAIPREIAQPRQDVDALQEPNGIRQHEEGAEEVQCGFHAPLGLPILPLVLAPRCPAAITGLRALGTIGRRGARFDHPHQVRWYCGLPYSCARCANSGVKTRSAIAWQRLIRRGSSAR